MPGRALRRWELDRLHRDADEAASWRAGDQKLCSCRPRNRGGNDHRVAANLGGGGDADSVPDAPKTAPPAKPSCSGAVMRITRSS